LWTEDGGRRIAPFVFRRSSFVQSTRYKATRATPSCGAYLNDQERNSGSDGIIVGVRLLPPCRHSAFYSPQILPPIWYNSVCFHRLRRAHRSG
jgi:hypothetical protein